ncbi:MAG TPA: hypothetical protein EYN90_02775 [Acidobacteria bacterium]|nr:hypothetical protein [Nitrospirales bacterium]HIA49499.1 hypothetical protein [Acidobacteriota bacterium]
MEELGATITLRDIERTPPSPAFLKRHVHHEDFLDFVSRRSPVFKRRTLPKSKREAIALMTDNPKLIRRPVLVVGYRVTFGFDKERYTDLVKSSH